MGFFIASAIDAMGEAASNTQNNTAAAARAKENRDWSERMSNTAHQREVADMQAAGLNPLLSATGGSGASTPSGSVAPVNKMHLPSAVNALNSAKTRESQDAIIKTQKEAVKTAKDTQANIKADTIVKQENARLISNNADRVARDAGKQEMQNSFWGDVNSLYQKGRISLKKGLETIQNNPVHTPDPMAGYMTNSAHTVPKPQTFNPNATIKDLGQQTDDARVKKSKPKHDTVKMGITFGNGKSHTYTYPINHRTKK